MAALALAVGVTFVVQYTMGLYSLLFYVCPHWKGSDGATELLAAINRAIAYFRGPEIGDY
jgi:hypothetical protein